MTEATASAEAPVYLKVSEVAVRLNISERAVYDLIAARELESSRFGGRKGVRVHEDSLIAYQQASRQS